MLFTLWNENVAEKMIHRLNLAVHPQSYTKQIKLSRQFFSLPMHSSLDDISDEKLVLKNQLERSITS